MTKVWYRSATLWALAVSALAHALVLLGVGESDAEAAAAELVRALAPVIGLVADAVGAWGRKRAAGPITLATDEWRID